MQINATLIVQMINFGIIYFLLDRILFRKVIVIVQDEEYQEQKILEDLHHEQKKLNSIKQTISAQWNESQQEFKKTIKKAIEKQNTEKKALIEELNDIKRNQIIHKEELANQKREAIQLKLNILKWRTKVDNQQDKIMEENILMTQQMSNRLKKQQEYLTLNQA